jgi:hypothetical protein
MGRDVTTDDQQATVLFRTDGKESTSSATFPLQQLDKHVPAATVLFRTDGKESTTFA